MEGQKKDTMHVHVEISLNVFSSGTRIHYVLHLNVHQKCQKRYENIIWYSLNLQVMKRYLERSARDNQREPCLNGDKETTTLHSPHHSDPQTFREQHPFPLASSAEKSRPEEASQRQTAREPLQEVLSGNVERQHQVRPKEYQRKNHKRFQSGIERQKGHFETNFNNPKTSQSGYGKGTSRPNEKMTETTLHECKPTVHVDGSRRQRAGVPDANPLKASGSSKAERASRSVARQDDRPKSNRESPVSQTEAAARSPRMQCHNDTCQKPGRCCTEAVMGASLESALSGVNKTPIC